MDTENQKTEKDDEFSYNKMFIKWHADRLTSAMKCKYLYDNNLLTDFTFKIVNDNKNENVDTNVIKCHKFVLSLASDEFFNLITKKNECELIIKEINFNTFKTFINYIYTNEIIVEKNLLKDLLKLSEYFNIIPLKEICWEHIAKNITKNTIIEFFEYAIAYDNATILELCENFYQENTEITLQTKEFLSINQNMLKRILSIDNITCTEFDLLKAVVAWGNHQVLAKGTGMSSDSLRKELNDFIPLIRFQTMQINEFLTFIQEYKHFFTNDEICEIILNFSNKNNIDNNKDVQINRTSIVKLLNQLEMSVCFRINKIEDCYTIDTYKKKKSIFDEFFSNDNHTFGTSKNNNLYSPHSSPSLFVNNAKQFNYSLQSPSIVSSNNNAKNYIDKDNGHNINAKQNYLLKFSCNKKILLKGFGILTKMHSNVALGSTIIVPPANQVNIVSYTICLTESKTKKIIYTNEEVFSKYEPKYQYLIGYAIKTLFLTKDILLNENTDYIFEMSSNVKSGHKKQIEICNNILYYGKKIINMEKSDICFTVDTLDENAKDFDENPIVQILFKGP